jgi:hypothetical protein
MDDIKDIKPPIDIPNAWIWIWWILAALIGVTLIVWLIFWFIKKPKAEKKIEFEEGAPWEKAYARLESLRSKGLMEREYLKPFYIDLSDIIRHYLEEQLSMKVSEMTTEEFLTSLKTSPVLNDSQQELLKEFLSICDMVKFAKFQPTKDEAKRSFDLAKLLVDRTHGI